MKVAPAGFAALGDLAEAGQLRRQIQSDYIIEMTPT